MAGLLLELRRQIRNKHRKNANSNGQKISQTAQRTSYRTADTGEPERAAPEVSESALEVTEPAQEPVFSELTKPMEKQGTEEPPEETVPERIIEAAVRSIVFGDDPEESENSGMGSGHAPEDASSPGSAFMPGVKWLMHIYERNMSIVSKDDILLKQIDEFRERAQQLQDMLDTRESQAEELQTLVDERQVKAEELGQILKERQEKADGLTAAVERQIDAMIDRVGVRLEEIEKSIREDVGAKAGNLETSVKTDVGAKLDRLESSMMNDVGAKLDRVEASVASVKTEVGMKLDRFAAMNSGGDVSARLDQMETSMREVLAESNRMSREQARAQGEDQLQETKAALEQIQQQLDIAKGELSDKVHSETVKCYRNVQELYKGMGDQLDKLNSISDIEETVKGTKSYGMIAVVVGVVNLVGILFTLLMTMGVF